MTQSPTRVAGAANPCGGPAPGIEFASPGARLVGYIVDILVIGAVCFTFSIVGFLIGFRAADPLGPRRGGRHHRSARLFPVVLDARRPDARDEADADQGRARHGRRPACRSGAAILRLIGFWVSTLVFYIGFIWIFIDKRQRGWPTSSAARSSSRPNVL